MLFVGLQSTLAIAIPRVDGQFAVKKERTTIYATNSCLTVRSIMASMRVEPGKTRIGWIGTGVMGRWMCQHLMTKGYQATVYNRSKDKARPLVEAGAVLT